MLIYCIWRIGRIRRELRLWRFMRRRAGFGRLEALQCVDRPAGRDGAAGCRLSEEPLNSVPALEQGRSALSRLQEARGAWSECGRTIRYGFPDVMAA